MGTFLKWVRFALALLAIMVLALAINVVRVPDLQPTVGIRAAIDVDTDAAAQRLANLLQIPTISSVDDDAPFVQITDTLRQQWPELYRTLTPQVINAHSQVLIWQGRNSTLDPLLLMAHLDVVPAASQHWQQDPFGGEIIDGEIWGRGALDNKGSAAAILEAVTALLQNGYVPERTVMIAFGYDEETGGLQGARHVAAWFEREKIRPWLVLDEGGFVLGNSPLPLDAPVALLGVAEKGYLSVQVSAYAVSGHSSMPPNDLAIFRLARALTRIDDSPLPMSLEGPTGATFDWLNSEMRWPEKLLFANRWLFDRLIMSQLARSPSGAALLHTTQAPTLLNAGIKENVLPETATATINLRVHPRDTADSIVAHLNAVIDDPAVEVTALNEFSSEAQQASDWRAPAFQVLAEAVRSNFPDARITPYLVVGATDARYFRPLTDQVYRFLPFRLDNSELSRLHGRDERVRVTDYIDAIHFYATLIQRSSEVGDE